MLQYSPKIVQDSLVMCLDASNNKSYPTDLPVKNGLNLWLDAADDTTFSYSSGTSVSQWRDKSGLNNHTSQATVLNQPSRSTAQNSRKIVTFDGTNDSLSTSNSLDLSVTHTIFAIASQTTGTSDAGLVSINNSLNNGLTLHNGSTYYSYYGDGSKYATSAITTSTSYIFTKVFKGTSSTTRQVYLNGTSATTTGVIANSDASGVIRLGQQSTYLNGTIAEVIIFNRELTATELKQVHTYLGQKWGISNTDRSIVDLAGNDDNGLFGNGTVANMPLYDFYNKGTLKFDGSNDYISIPYNSGLVPNTLTLSAWINRTAAVSYAHFIGVPISNTTWATPYVSYGIEYIGTTDTISLVTGYTDNNFDYTSATAFGNDTWFHFAATYDKTNVKIYINGVLRTTRAETRTLYASTANFYIGSNNTTSGYPLNGKIANTLLYSRALSAAEVLQNYEAQKSKFANTIVQSGLVLNLDVGNPYSYAGAGTTIYDVSATALSWTGSNVTYNSDPIKYFSYNGSSSWLQSSTSTAYDSQTITMECWCYPNTLSQDGFLFEKGSVNTQYSMFFSTTNNIFYFRTFGGTINNQDLFFTTTSYLTVSAWNHIVCTYNGSVKTIYVNGAQVATVAASGTLQTGQTNQYIGKYGAVGNNYPFNGRIAESRVYNTALSDAQVLQNYNATKGRFGL